MRPRTSLSYAARIERVVVYIGEHLDGSLTLERLAEQAAFSPFQFHRIYRLVMGETVYQTVRRLRLHRAAVALSQDQVALRRIATAAGYGSLEAFSRAFAAAYGVSPSHFRAARRLPSPGGLENVVVNTVSREVVLKACPGLRLAGMIHRGPYHEMGLTFERLYAWAGPRGLVDAEACAYGVYYDDPDSVPPDQLRSLAGIVVPVDVDPEPGIEVVEIPPGPVAALLYRGPYADLEDAYSYLYGVWLPQSGREPAHSPPFEVYLNDPKLVPPTEWLTEVNVPLLA